jgi:hypothetical protein
MIGPVSDAPSGYSGIMELGTGGDRHQVNMCSFTHSRTLVSQVCNNVPYMIGTGARLRFQHYQRRPTINGLGQGRPQFRNPPGKAWNSRYSRLALIPG